jgi:hypothetical protein
MMNIMVESSMTVGNSWRAESEGGVADIHIDEYMRSFLGDVISRACFGSNYSKGDMGRSCIYGNGCEELMGRSCSTGGHFHPLFSPVL